MTVGSVALRAVRIPRQFTGKEDTKERTHLDHEVTDSILDILNLNFLQHITVVFWKLTGHTLL